MKSASELIDIESRINQILVWERLTIFRLVLSFLKQIKNPGLKVYYVMITPFASKLMNFLKFKHESKNKFDATDALGAALCHHFQTNLKSKESSSWKKFVSKNKARIIN